MAFVCPDQAVLVGVGNLLESMSGWEYNVTGEVGMLCLN